MSAVRLRGPPKTSPWGAVRVVAWAIAGGIFLWLGGLLWFATPPAAESEASPTDAIVVLTGGNLRVQSGIELLREGKGGKLFVSGVDKQVDLADLLRMSGIAQEWSPNWASCCVVLGYEAGNTLGNAHETARWIRSQGFHSLRLVTAWYHMPRSLLEFDRAMPEIEIVAHPVFTGEVDEERWWTSRQSAARLVSEYMKFLATLGRPLVEWLPPEKIGRAEPAQAEMLR